MNTAALMTTIALAGLAFASCNRNKGLTFEDFERMEQEEQAHELAQEEADEEIKKLAAEHKERIAIADEVRTERLEARRIEMETTKAEGETPTAFSFFGQKFEE